MNSRFTLLWVCEIEKKQIAVTTGLQGALAQSFETSTHVLLLHSDGAGYERPWRVNARGALSAGYRVVLAMPVVSRG